jgi:hypothetical protein
MINYRKQYNDKNKIKIFEQQRKYREENKEKLADTKKVYYEKNKYKICSITHCDCGGTYTYQQGNRHFKTMKHQNYLMKLCNQKVE